LKLIKKFRKIYYLLFIIFATIITPPDIATQLLLCGCIIVIFEILIFSVLFQSCFNLEAS
jgi:Sec-independent protein secretion pathway component TatC